MGRKRKAKGEGVHPEPGELMPDFSLPTPDGRRLSIAGYRGRFSLLMIFTGGAECSYCRHVVLSDLCQEPEEYSRQGAQLLVILCCSPMEAELVRHRDSLACPVLVDEDGHVHRSVAALNSDDQPSTSIFIADRQGNVRLASRSWQGDPIPTRETLLEQLRRAP